MRGKERKRGEEEGRKEEGKKKERAKNSSWNQTKTTQHNAVISFGSSWLSLYGIHPRRGREKGAQWTMGRGRGRRECQLKR